MTIEKVLLQTPLCALDFKANLEALDVPARLTVNVSGNPSRYVVFDSTNLTKERIVSIDEIHKPDYVRVCIEDVYFEEEVN